jgi:hypothetical protein
MRLKAVHVWVMSLLVKDFFLNFNRIMSAITENINKHPNVCNTQYILCKKCEFSLHITLQDITPMYKHNFYELALVIVHKEYSTYVSLLNTEM